MEVQGLISGLGEGWKLCPYGFSLMVISFSVGEDVETQTSTGRHHYSLNPEPLKP